MRLLIRSFFTIFHSWILLQNYRFFQAQRVTMLRVLQAEASEKGPHVVPVIPPAVVSVTHGQMMVGAFRC